LIALLPVDVVFI